MPFIRRHRRMASRLAHGRMVRWSDDRSVWTGSCPCQPYSASGKHKGGADSRDLWPVWFCLMQGCIEADIEIPIIFGEQVANAISHGWLDRVFVDMGCAGYTCGAAVLPAAGVGAPHLRNRLWYVAHTTGSERRPPAKGRNVDDGTNTGRKKTSGGCEIHGDRGLHDPPSISGRQPARETTRTALA